jgi:hypothetical protein
MMNSNTWDVRSATVDLVLLGRARLFSARKRSDVAQRCKLDNVVGRQHNALIRRHSRMLLERFAAALKQPRESPSGVTASQPLSLDKLKISKYKEGKMLKYIEHVTIILLSLRFYFSV